MISKHIIKKIMKIQCNILPDNVLSSIDKILASLFIETHHRTTLYYACGLGINGLFWEQIL